MTTQTQQATDFNCGYYFVHGLANLKFMVPHHSERYLALKQAEKDGSIKAMFPNSPVPRAATGMTKQEGRDILAEQLYAFDRDGNFKTKSEELAIIAYRSSYWFNATSKNVTSVDAFSKPLPESAFVAPPKKQEAAKVPFIDKDGFAVSQKHAWSIHSEQQQEAPKPEKGAKR